MQVMLSQIDMVVDNAECTWDALRRVDPVRYVQLLELAKRIVLAHADPLARLPLDSVSSVLLSDRKGSA